MKALSFLFFIALSFTGIAQDPQLFDNDWYLTKITIDGTDILPPNVPVEPETGRIYFYNTNNEVIIEYCESIGTFGTYDSTANQITLEPSTSVLVGFCSQPPNFNFMFDYFSVFYNDQDIAKNPFTYTFSSGGNGK